MKKTVRLAGSLLIGQGNPIPGSPSCAPVLKNRVAFSRNLVFRLFLLLVVLGSAQVGWSQVNLSNGSSSATIDFSNTTPASVGTNPASAFTGAGFSPDPTTAGRLNSNAWAVTGWSDGSLAFGGTNTSGDHARGTTSAAVFTGGFYAYTGSPQSAANPCLMIQPGGSDFAPGTLTLRIKNTGTSPITKLDVSYNIYVRNDQGRGNSFNFSHSTDNSTYTPVGGLDYTSPTSADASGWVLIGSAPSRSTTITGLLVAPNSFIYIRWSSADVGGAGSRDEFGLDDISLTATFCPTITFTGTPTPTCPASTNGQIAVSGITGGTGPYMYSKDNGTNYQSGAIFAGLAANTYQVVVKDNNGCTSGATAVIVGTATPPSCNVSGADDVCSNSTGNVYTAPGGMDAYSWGISGSGTITSPTNGSSVTVTAGNYLNTYTVSVTVTDANGCTSTCSKVSDIFLRTPPANITVNPNPACFGATLDLSIAAQSSSTVSWTGEGIVNSSGNFIPNNNPFYDFNNVTTAIPTTTGPHIYSVTVTSDQGCSNTGTATVTVHPAPPTCSIIGPPPSPGPNNDTLCIGQQYVFTGPPGMSAYQWGVSTNCSINGSNTGSSVTVTVNSGSSMAVYVTITDANGCMSNCSLSRYVQSAPTCSINGSLSVCGGSTDNVYTATSDAGMFGYYVWSISGDGAITSSPTSGYNVTSVSVTAGASGTYTVTVEVYNYNTCASNCSETVTINSASTPTITGPTSVCSGGSALLDAGAGYNSYAWSNGGGSGQTATFNNITLPTTYTVTVTDGNGCAGTGTHSVNVYANPTPTITGPTTVCSNGSVMLDAGAGYDSYAWSNGGGSGQTATFNNINANTTYTVTVTDDNSCAGTDTHTVTVQSCLVEFSGKIIFSNNNSFGVNNATVKLTGSATGTDLSDINGDYMIATALTTGSFTLKPTKNINKFNGVNAGDVTAIQQHVNFTVPITDPYKLVCADVNKSNSITAFDVSLITQALLGNPQANAIFNTSWRFTPTTPVLNNPPWGFAEQRTYTNVSGPQINQDFYGMKIGDVTTAYANPANFGAGEPLVLRAKDQLLQSGKTLAIDFSADQLDDLAAFQFGLTFDPAQLQFEAVEATGGLPVTADHFGTYDVAKGEIRAVWAQATGLQVEEATPAFRLRFTALQSGAKLRDVLQLNDAVLPALSYTGKLAESKVELTFSEATGAIDPASVSALQMQVRPNPFREETTVTFSLPAAGEAQLRVLDVNGRELLRINNTYPAGRHSETLRLDGVTAPGVLTCELITPFGVATRKLVVVN